MYCRFKIRIHLLLIFFIITSPSMAMEVPQQVNGSEFPVSPMDLVAKEINQVFQAKEAFVMGVIGEMLKITNPDEFKDFLADLSDIKCDGSMVITDFKLFKKSNIDRLLLILKEQRGFQQQILNKINRFSAMKTHFLKLKNWQAQNHDDYDQKYLIELYLFIYEGQQNTLANRAKNTQEVFSEALKGKKQNLANARKKQSQHGNYQEVFIAFSEEIRPFSTYQSSMDIILESLNPDLANFLVQQTSFGPKSGSSEAVVKLSRLKFSQEALDESLHTYNQTLKKLCDTKNLLNPDADLNHDSFLIECERKSRDFSVSVRNYKLRELFELKSAEEMPDCEIIHADDLHNYDKIDRIIKDFEKKNFFLSIEQATNEVKCELNGVEKALRAKKKVEAKAIKKAEENKQTDSATESTLSEDVAQEINFPSEINEQPISEEANSVIEDYELENWKKYNSKKRITNAENKCASEVMSKFDRTVSMVKEFNKTQYDVYLALLDDKTHHKKFSTLDLVSVVAGFNGVPFAGHNGSHFTFKIPDFGSVYILKTHGNKDCRMLTGSTFNIFRERLKSLGLLSPELKKYYL